MLKAIMEVDGDEIRVHDYDHVAEEAAAQGWEHWNEMFGDSDNVMDYCDVTVRYDHEATTEDFTVRIYIVQNPFIPQIEIEQLAPILADSGKRIVARFLAEQEIKQAKAAKRKKAKSRKQATMQKIDIDDIPF